MPNITPHLWYDKNTALQAAKFYVSVFGGDSAIHGNTDLIDTPSGEVNMVDFTLLGQNFSAISAGPEFKFNPSVSFMVNFDPSTDPAADTKIKSVWEKLSDGGTMRMPLQEYPFSKCYGWVADKYGLDWQLILTNPDGDPRPAIIPSLMFAADNFGNAAAATAFYRSVFKTGQNGIQVPYGAEQGADLKGKVMFSDFKLNNLWFTAMDGPGQPFKFNEAISFMISCESQSEIDYYWEKLSAHPEAEQCGWCKDKFGLSWQIVPTTLSEMLQGSAEQVQRVTQTFLKMKKFDIAALQQVFDGK